MTTGIIRSGDVCTKCRVTGHNEYNCNTNTNSIATRIFNAVLAALKAIARLFTSSKHSDSNACDKGSCRDSGYIPGGRSRKQDRQRIKQFMGQTPQADAEANAPVEGRSGNATPLNKAEKKTINPTTRKRCRRKTKRTSTKNKREGKTKKIVTNPLATAAVEEARKRLRNSIQPTGQL